MSGSLYCYIRNAPAYVYESKDSIRVFAERDQFVLEGISILHFNGLTIIAQVIENLIMTDKHFFCLLIFLFYLWYKNCIPYSNIDVYNPLQNKFGRLKNILMFYLSLSLPANRVVRSSFHIYLHYLICCYNMLLMRFDL